MAWARGLPWQLVGDLAALAQACCWPLTSLLMWNKLHGPAGRGITLLLGALVTVLVAPFPALYRHQNGIPLPGGGNLARTSGNKG